MENFNLNESLDTQKMTQSPIELCVGTARVAQCLGEYGINKSQSSTINAIELKLLQLKKKGVEKPIFSRVIPKKPAKTETDPVVLDNYKSQHEDYLKAKAEFEVELRKYESFSSVEYKRASLAYKLLRKLKKLVKLLEDNAKNQTEGRSKQIQKIFESLKGGLKKPIVSEVGEGKAKKRVISGQEITMKFTDIYGDIPSDIEQLKILLAKVNIEFKDTNELFEQKDQVKGTCLRFDKKVTYGVTYLIQETIADLMGAAMKNCKSSTKSTINVENFSSNVLKDSPYFVLYSNLPCTKVLDEYMKRKVDSETELGKLSPKERSKRKSFLDLEKTGGFMKEIKGRKYWDGLNKIQDENNFVIYVENIFDVVKSKLKNKAPKNCKLSTRAKEFVSNMIVEFIKSLCYRFECYKQHKTKFTDAPNQKEQKTINIQTVVMIFDIILCNSKLNDLLKAAVNVKANLKSNK